MLTQQLLNGITLGSIYALIALGYTMVYGIIQLINFAHGEILMIGTYLALTFLTVFHIPPLPSIILAMGGGALLGVVIERIAYRPLRETAKLDVITFFASLMAVFITLLFSEFYGKSLLSWLILPGIFYLLGASGLVGHFMTLSALKWGGMSIASALIYAMGSGWLIGLVTTRMLKSLPWAYAHEKRFLVSVSGQLGIHVKQHSERGTQNASRLSALISALGVSIFLQNLAMLIWGTHPLRFPDILPNHQIPLGTLTFSTLQITIFAIAISLMVGLFWFVQKTKLGRAMRATALDRECASLLGVNVNQVIAITFMIGSALASVAGIMVGSYYHTVFPTIGYFISLKAFAAAVLGGIGNIPGAMVGGFLLGVIEILGISGIPVVHYVGGGLLGGLFGHRLGTWWSRAPRIRWGMAVLGSVLGYLSIKLLERYGFAGIPSGFQDAISFSLLILVLIFRPTGLLGEQVTDKS